MSAESKAPNSPALARPAWRPPSVEQLQALLPQYEIVSLLGHGGMGAVYEGRQKSLDRLVAIKILPTSLDEGDANFSERFKNEARIMARLNHPGIVSVHDSGETGEGRLFIVMEHVSGTDLAKLLAAKGALPPEQALAIAAHVCDALACAHEAGVVHRDIKPGNVLIDRKGRVKVADFGLAKMDDPARNVALTVTGLAMGTPDYVAPEVLLHGSGVDGRADVFSLGVMLYQMLTGEVPRGLFAMPGAASGGVIDPRFDEIIAKAMQSKPEARYGSAAEMRADLNAISVTHRGDSASGAAIPPGEVARVMQMRPAGAAANDGANAKARRNLWRFAAFCLAAIVLAALGMTMWNRRSGAPPPPPVAALPPGGWQPMITDHAAALAVPGVVFKDGWYSRVYPNQNGAYRDVAVRARVRYHTGGSPMLRVRGARRAEGVMNYSAEILPESPDIIRLRMNFVSGEGRRVVEKSKNLGQWRLPKPLADGEEFGYALSARGPSLTVWFNGRPVITAADRTLEEGSISAGSNGKGDEWRDIEWCELSSR